MNPPIREAVTFAAVVETPMKDWPFTLSFPHYGMDIVNTANDHDRVGSHLQDMYGHKSRYGINGINADHFDQIYDCADPHPGPQLQPMHKPGKTEHYRYLNSRLDTKEKTCV